MPIFNECVPMLDYTKPPLLYSDQLALLEKRGLIVKDKNSAESFLRQVNYYRFSAYCIPFESSRHVFKTDVKFEDICMLYEFDRRLRFLIDEALEIIEITLRTKIAYYLAHCYGSFIHEDQSFFYPHFDHAAWISKVHSEIDRSTETFITHYKKTYNGFPRIPIWMAVEVMTLGSLSVLYNNLLRSDQIALAKDIGIHSTVLSSWLHTITYVRNICAHHCRIWNRELAIAMKFPKDRGWIGLNAKRIGCVIFAIITLLKCLQLEKKVLESWHNEFTGLLKQPVDIPDFYLRMGLPTNLDTHTLWKV
jgi:abortive infection bacteriophage resistance protein